MDQDVGIVKGKVCVTGASGYVASWLVKRLLLSGYHVKGTVRDPGNHKKLAHLWKLEGAKERLEVVKADLMEEGSFDDAIMGCDGVFHTASPVLGPKSDPQTEILDPAVNGTLNMLRSCKKNPQLKRVVLTSSSSTVRVRDDINPAIPLDESSWSSTQLCQRLKIWYPLSKIMAEKAAWDFAQENGIDLVTILPTFIIGPSLPSDFFHGTEEWGIYTDDVALSHILVYENPNAHGRYLCSSLVVDNTELASFLAKRYPLLPIPDPNRFKRLERPYYELDTSKLKSLGIKLKGIEEMFDDCVASLKEKNVNATCCP
ncbi:Tetraketide alpha-pyrone reductase 1 [Ranunculus cassubicifolius]